MIKYYQRPPYNTLYRFTVNMSAVANNPSNKNTKIDRWDAGKL